MRARLQNPFSAPSLPALSPSMANCSAFPKTLAVPVSPSHVARLPSPPHVPLKPFQSAPDSGPRHACDARPCVQDGSCDFTLSLPALHSQLHFSLFAFVLSVLLLGPVAARNSNIVVRLRRRFLSLVYFGKAVAYHLLSTRRGGCLFPKRGIPPHTQSQAPDLTDAPLCLALCS